MDDDHDPLYGLTVIASVSAGFPGRCTIDEEHVIVKKSLIHKVKPDDSPDPLEGFACDQCGSAIQARGSRNVLRLDKKKAGGRVSLS